MLHRRESDQSGQTRPHRLRLRRRSNLPRMPPRWARGRPSARLIKPQSPTLVTTFSCKRRLFTAMGGGKSEPVSGSESSALLLDLREKRWRSLLSDVEQQTPRRSEGLIYRRPPLQPFVSAFISTSEEWKDVAGAEFGNRICGNCGIPDRMASRENMKGGNICFMLMLLFPFCCF